MITKEKILNIQEKIKKALKKIEEEENVSINFESIRYTKFKYSSKMNVISKEKTKDGETLDKKMNEDISKRYGFTQNIVGMVFISSDKKMKITSFKTRNRKYPIIAEDIDSGKSYKYPVEMVKRLLGGDKIINRNSNLKKILK
jgi:hypothetical protein